MGVAVLLLLFLPLLLTSPAARAQTQNQEAVLDSAGNPLQRGAQYWVLPLFFNVGGGLTMSRVNGSCPPHVAVLSSEVARGEPLMFSPEESREDGVVRVSERIYVQFPRRSSCPLSTLWRRRADGGEYITTGGTVSSADPNSSRFAILKSSTGRGYVIRHCPCRRCRLPCWNVVVKRVNDEELLGLSLSDDPYRVRFVKVEE